MDLPETIFVSSVSSADIELISGRLSAFEFDQLDQALISQSFLFTQLDVEHGKRLHSGERATIQGFQHSIEGGLHALVEVADLPAESSSANGQGSGT